MRRGRRRLPHAVKGGVFRLRKEPPPPAAPEATEEEYHTGALRLGSEGWRTPEALVEAGEAGSTDFRPGRVMLVITILGIVFIAVMAWFVSQMPRK